MSKQLETNIIDNLPESLKLLYKKNNINIQKKIIKHLTSYPSSIDKKGYVYGFFSGKDKINTRQNFYIKIGRTDKSNPIDRVNEWSHWNPAVKYIEGAMFNRKLEKLVHLFFNYVNEARLTTNREIEWFNFKEKISVGMFISQINELIEDLFIIDNNNHISKKEHDDCTKDKKTINISMATEKELINLPGIGKNLAKRIINYRKLHKFVGIRDIMDVPYVNTTKFNDIKDRISV